MRLITSHCKNKGVQKRHTGPQNRTDNLERPWQRKRWTGHVARMEEDRSAFKILTGKPTAKRPLGRPRRRWEDNIRMDLEEIGINAGN